MGARHLVSDSNTKRNSWKHAYGFVAIDEEDFPTQVFVYASSESRPVDRGTYFVTARAVLAPSTKADSDDAVSTN